LFQDNNRKRFVQIKIIYI